MKFGYHAARNSRNSNKLKETSSTNHAYRSHHDVYIIYLHRPKINFVNQYISFEYDYIHITNCSAVTISQKMTSLTLSDLYINSIWFFLPMTTLTFIYFAFINLFLYSNVKDADDQIIQQKRTKKVIHLICTYLDK